MMLKLLIFLKNFIVEHPFLVKDWIFNFFKEIKRNPIFIGLIIYTAYNLSYFYFIHKNAHFINNVEAIEIEEEINLALNECGNGATIARVSIGTLYATSDKTSLFVDTVRSCDKALAGERDDGTCDLDVSWINRSWKKVHDLEQDTLDLMNGTHISLGMNYNYPFKDGQPIWLEIFNRDGSLADSGIALNIIAPELFGILKSSKRSIEKIGVVKVTHPIYHHIVYLFTLSFWYNENGMPEKKCEHTKTAILKALAKKQKHQLLYK